MDWILHIQNNNIFLVPCGLILRYCIINKYCFSREIGRKLLEAMVFFLKQ